MFAKRFKEARESMDLSQKDMAKILNVGPSTVSMWEQDRRTPDKEMLIKIANYFDISIDYLFGRTDDPKNIVYSAVVDGDKVDLEFDKDYPHKLTPEEVEQLIKKLKEARFDVDGLIEEIQNKDKK